MRIFRAFFQTTVCFVFLVTSVISVHASSEDLYQRSGSVGLYLRIPLGESREHTDKVNYGLRLSMDQNFQTQSPWQNPALHYHRPLQMDVLSFNFNEDGFRDLSLAGQSAIIIKDGKLYAAGDNEENDNEESGSSTGYWIIGILGVLMLGGYIAAKETGDGLSEAIQNIGDDLTD